jgi:PadR family transcriptional regulator PadR
MADRQLQYSGFDRDLLRGSLDLLILAEIGAAECYGYQILAALREKSGGRVDLRAGTLYPILHKLEADGCVASRWDDAAGRDRKWYSLTARGRERLEAHTREWLDYAACLQRMLRPIVAALGQPTASDLTNPGRTSA